MRLASLLFMMVLPALTRTIEGDIVDAATGVPVTGARVKLSLPSGDSTYSVADNRGHFRFEITGTGSYKLSVQGRGYLEATQISNPTPSGAGLPGPNLKIALVPYAVVTGKLTGPDGIPLLHATIDAFTTRPVVSGDAERVNVRLLPDGKTALVGALQATVDDRGEYRIAPLAPGTYYLAATQALPSDPAYQVTYYPHAIDLSAARPLELTPGQHLQVDMQIAVAAGVRIAGRIIPPQGRTAPPDSYSNVVLGKPDSTLYIDSSRFAVGANNRYELRGVLPGTYILLAATMGPGETPWAMRPQLFGTLRRIEVGERDMDGFDVQMQELAPLAGTVTFVDGCTPVAVHVVVSGSGAGVLSRSGATPGADGRFVLTGMGPAHLGLSVTAPSAHAVSARLGDRDVLKDGFDYPVVPGNDLQIAMDCAGKGGRQ